jgi:hypothetical protein
VEIIVKEEEREKVIKSWKLLYHKKEVKEKRNCSRPFQG